MNTRYALLIITTVILAFGPGVFPAMAQTEIEQLRSENRALRRELASIKDASTDTTQCAPMGDISQTTAHRLLGKIAKNAAGSALQNLGLTPTNNAIPSNILGSFVPNEYIILTAENSNSIADIATKFALSPGQIMHRYSAALNGFSARLTRNEQQRLANDPTVIAVVQNGYVFAASNATNQTAPQPTNNTPDLLVAIKNPVQIYVFDTGIRAAHSDLVGRVSSDGYSAFNNGLRGEDCSGHGTHVAGLIAGRRLGITDKAILTSVKVIDRFGTGDVATVIAGIEWVMGQPGEHKLINMSLTRRIVETISPLDIAVNALIDSGATVVVAAGNAASDVADFSPARVARAITVGSVNGTSLSNFSNAGLGVDLYTAGENAVSASIRDVCAIRQMSGTSMAAPIITGQLATLIYNGNAPIDALMVLRLRAKTHPTGAFIGEKERQILSLSPRAIVNSICPNGATTRYDTGVSPLRNP